jgi:phage terminase large subunit-like protein
MLFFEAGASYNERALIAANRVGKTMAAMYEAAVHLTGRYPDWWPGKKFRYPIEAWAVGKTHETTRDILQKYLIGNRYEPGTGLIPREDMDWDGKIHITAKSIPAGAIQDLYCKHYTDGIFDGYSHCQFKSYKDGVEAFMGTSIDLICLDEEPTETSIYDECLIRTMTTKGIIICTFTPKEGLSDVVLKFLPNGKFPMNGYGVVSNV